MALFSKSSSKSTDIINCFISSKVLLDSTEKIVKTIQTGNVDAIITISTGLIPGMVDECKKCFSAE